MRKISDDTYKLTLWGSVRAVPQIAVSMVYPFVRSLVGRRSARSRKRYLEHAARKARALPPEWRMKT
jgi:hypothetical protein